MKVPKGDQREPIILDDAQYEKLLAEAGKSTAPMLLPYLMVLGEAGLRCDRRRCGCAGTTSTSRMGS